MAPEQGEVQELCQCGCGQPAPIAKRTDTSRGRFKGKPMRFIRGHNAHGVDRTGPRIEQRWVEENRGYETPCWIWQLRIHKATGYGMLKVAGRDWLAHRWHYTEAHGPIPEGLQLDHLCGVRECVNPAHLEPVTGMENTRRGRPAKLTLAQAEEIYRRRLNGETIDALAAEFPVNRESVRLIGIRGPHSSRRER